MKDSAPADMGNVRQAAIDALCEHFAKDALSVEEFEARVEMVHRATSTEELRQLLSDLPTGDLPVRKEDALPAGAERARASVPAHRVKEKGLMVAALGGVERKGRWIPARQNFVMAVMGGVSLDFREALLPPGETEVWIFTMMGGAEILVPPGLALECDGIAILGGFDHRDDAPIQNDPDAPLLRLRGLAVMGGVEVSIRLPGESAKEARRRLKDAAKGRRRLRGGQ